MIFEVYDHMVDDAEAQEKNLLYEQELDLLNRQAQERTEYDTEMRKLRHDMKNHMSSLLGMLQVNDTRQAEEYVRGILQESLNRRTNDVSCTGNIIVDNLVNHKCGIAKAEGITFVANVFLPAELPFRGGHLTIVLGNLLDNALEACREIEEGNRYITLDASYEKEVLMLVVINPYRGERKKDRAGKYITTKKDCRSHGLGLSSVEQAVEAYHGQVDAESRNGVFKVSVVMYGAKEKK
ncbi:MAG: sensor histidine kinase [Lachnospiraceae bacterium]|nr:sensor histidine kinase [Lachnospiraceae bacterium]